MNRKIAFMMTAALLLGTATLRACRCGRPWPPLVCRRRQQPRRRVPRCPTSSSGSSGPPSRGRTAAPDHRIRLHQYGEAAQNVELKISELDASGHAASSVNPARIWDRSRRGPRVLRCEGPEQLILPGRRAVVRFLELEN